ncbi:hypothetical protein [Polyangium sp. y55x31]|uniref:hypothetical protein n=1 Tax=Polyangium sp. y55x31 TaxID=3042688 RepID=UPI0024824341|nr:hypothetical protein [Polyangium sp. y55x31]MDI1484367.1 hypothetical protein [Polyangium sp. y55x31]
MSVAEIDSEARQNIVETEPQFVPSTHCVVIMEQPPLMGDEPPPQWRVSVTLTLRDKALGKGAVLADLPTVIVGPLIHKRQVVAIAKYPSPVDRWSFRFESDAGRATARVWLHPGTSPVTECGLFVVQHGWKE